MIDLALVPDDGIAWLDGSGAESPIVLSTRIRLARNLAGHPLSQRSRDADRLAVLALVREAAATLPPLVGAVTFRLDELERPDRQVLHERHLVSKELAGLEAGGRPRAPVQAGETPAVVASIQPAATPAIIVDDPAALADLAAAIRRTGRVAVRAWAADGDPRSTRLLGLGLALEPGRTWYLPFAHEPPDGALAAPQLVRNLPGLMDPLARPLAETLADPAVSLVGHDLKREDEALRGAGVEIGRYGDDVMLASFLVDPGRRSQTNSTPSPSTTSGLGSSASRRPRAPQRASCPASRRSRP